MTDKREQILAPICWALPRVCPELLQLSATRTRSATGSGLASSFSTPTRRPMTGIRQDWHGGRTPRDGSA